MKQPTPDCHSLRCTSVSACKACRRAKSARAAACAALLILIVSNAGPLSAQVQPFAPEVPAWVHSPEEILDGLEKGRTVGQTPDRRGRGYARHTEGVRRGPTGTLLDGSLSWRSWIGHPLSSTRRPQRGNDQFQFELGLYRFAKKEYQRAAEAFRTILVRFKDSTLKEKALFWLGESYAGSGEWEEAEQAYRILLQGNPDRPLRETVLLELAEISRRKESLEDALRYYRTFLDESPDSVMASVVAVRMGEVFSLLGRFDAAADQFRTVSAEHLYEDDSGAVVFKWAEAHRLDGACRDALVRYEAYLEEHPSGSFRDAARYGRGWCLLMEESAEAAGTAFAVMVQDSPESIFADEAALMAGWSYRAAGRMEQSDRLLEVLAKNFSASPWLDRGLFLLALNAYERGDYEEARAGFRQVVGAGREGETLLRSRFMEGASLAGLGRFDEALTVFSRLLEKQDEEIVDTVLPWAAAAGFHGGKGDEAEAFLLSAAKDAKDRNVEAEAWYWVGALRLGGARYTEASLALGKALDVLQPGSSRDRALLLLAEVYYAQKNMREAEVRLRRILEREKGSEYVRQARIRLAEVLSYQGEEAEPTSIYQSVLKDKRAEETDRARFGLGMLYYREKEYLRAAGEFSTLLQESPGSEFADDSSFMLAMTSYRKGDYLKASEALKYFLVRFPNSTLAIEAQLRMADAFYRLRRHDEAESVYEEVIRRAEGTKDAAVAAYGLNLIALARGNTDAYLSSTRAFVESYPDDDLAPAALAQAARQLVLQERYVEGGNMMEMLLAGFPGDSSMADIFLLSALADRDAASYEESFRRLTMEKGESRECLRQAPLRFSLANLHLERERCEDALEELSVIIQTCPEHPLAVFAIFDSAGCLLRNGDQQGAVKAYTEIVERYPESSLRAGAEYLRGVVLLESGDYGRADELLKEMAGEGGDVLAGAVAFQRGKALQGLGRVREAYEQYRFSRELSPEGKFAERAAFRAAEIARGAGWKEEAARLYRIVMEGEEEVLTELARDGLRDVERASGGSD